MNNELLIAAIGIVATVVGSWASWFFTRRKYNSEVDNTIIENMKQSLEFYTKLSDDNKARLEEALRRNEQLEGEIRDLRKQMFELMNNICYDLSCSYRSKLPKVRMPKANVEKKQPNKTQKDENN